MNPNKSRTSLTNEITNATEFKNIQYKINVNTHTNDTILFDKCGVVFATAVNREAITTMGGINTENNTQKKITNITEEMPNFWDVMYRFTRKAYQYWRIQTEKRNSTNILSHQDLPELQVQRFWIAENDVFDEAIERLIEKITEIYYLEVCENGDAWAMKNNALTMLIGKSWAEVSLEDEPLPTAIQKQIND